MKPLERVRTRQDLLYLLSHAAEIEHSLCCQYLYAAFSLKEQGDPGVTDEQAAAIAQWRATLIDIATQEMLHLGLVCNLITAIGGSPNFHKANFPQPWAYSPIGLDFRLAPASVKSLRRFACFELPPDLAAKSIYRAWPVPGQDPVDWTQACECIKGKRKPHIEPKKQLKLLPAYFNYTSIGELYDLIKQGFEELYPHDESRLFIGPPNAQTADMWSELIPVTGRASAARAIDTIIREGEGAFGDDADIAKAHFGRFVELWTEMVEGAGGTSPSRDTIENPVVAFHPDIDMPDPGKKGQPWKQPTLLTAPVARAANEIFIATNELALHILKRYFADAGETEEQRYILKQTFLSLMRFCIAPLGTAITHLPAFRDQPDGPRAGASFELFTAISLLPQLPSAWRYFSERLEQISVAAAKLAENELAAPYPKLQQALAGIDDAPGLPGLANVCEQYSTLIHVGLDPPETRTWENGIRCLFSPLDVLRMGSWIVSEDSVRANLDEIVLRITGTGGTTTMPPPYQLGDPKAPSRYANPEGSWTIERISTFIEWAAQPVEKKATKWPTNPTWYNAVKGMFTAGDIKCMIRMAGIDLGNYSQVAARADDIYAQVLSGSMPPTAPWKKEQVACFKTWMDQGKKEGTAPKLRYDWAPTGAPLASSRYDDIWFTDENTGWAVNSNGHILHTKDGGDTWVQQFQSPIVPGGAGSDPGGGAGKSGHGNPVYLRCIEFANPKRGWVGTFNQQYLLFETHDGETWTQVKGLPDDAPAKLCGVSVVNENVIYFSGTNEPEDHARVMKTTDGGKTWSVIDMAPYATLLVDCYFWDENRGVVVGGINCTGAANPGRLDVKPVILFTEDGGQTWQNRLANTQDNYPLGEWGWKIQFINDLVGFVSLESFEHGAISKTTDGGKTWVRLAINDAQHNVDLEGIGFIDENTGWVGGWGNMTGTAGFTSATSDGGQNWTNANDVGLFINRFRFFGDPVTVGYASGITVYKLVVHDGLKPPPRKKLQVARPRMLQPPAPRSFTDKLEIPVMLPKGLKYASLHVWDHFGRDMATPLNLKNPRPGPLTVVWDGKHEDGKTQGSGLYIYRLTTDRDAESGIVHHEREE